MTTDAIYEECGSDWSHQLFAWQQLNSCSVTRPFLSAKGVACKTIFRQGDKLSGYNKGYVVCKTKLIPRPKGGGAGNVTLT